MRCDRVVGPRIIAENHVIRVEGLRDPDSRRPRRLQVQRQSEVIEGVQAIPPADGEKSRRVQPAVQNIGESLADPVQIGNARAVLERKHQQQTPMHLPRFGRLGIGWLLRARAGNRQEEDKEEAESTKSLHDTVIICRASGPMVLIFSSLPQSLQFREVCGGLV